MEVEGEWKPEWALGRGNIREAMMLMARSAAKFCIMALELMLPFIRQRVSSV